MTNKTPITTTGYKKIEEELNQLIKVEREELKVKISEARELGDLKENAEYHAAKEKQSMLEGRIGQLQHIVASSQVINVSEINSDSVVFGATVKLLNVETEESVTYQIVGSEEANSNEGKISYTSPLGKALIGKEEGDEVVVKAPKGDIEYEIESVSYK